MLHPFEEVVGTPLWEAINSALDDLVEAEHIEEITAEREYIIGHLYQKINGSLDVGFCTSC